MDAFLGSWKTVNSVHFDKYVEAVGISGAMNQYMRNMATEIIFSQDGDNIVMKIKMYEKTDRAHTLSFKLGEEFDEVSIDFRSCKSVFNLEGGKLIQLQKWDGKVTTIIREIQDGKLISTFTLGDVVSVRTYERI